MTRPSTGGPVPDPGSGHDHAGHDHAGHDHAPRSHLALAPQQFAGDRGEPDPALAEALARYAAGSAGEGEVVAALAGTRLIIPVVPAPDDTPGAEPDPDSRSEPDPDRGRVPRSAAQRRPAPDLAMVTLTGRDGRRALPVFTGVAALAAWNPAARPLPVDVAGAVLSCVEESCDVLVLDLAGPVTFVVRRPAVWALGQGRTWTPSPEDDEVRAAVTAACELGPPVLGARCERGETAELRVVLTLAPGLSRQALDAVLARVGERIAAHELVAERVDSLELRVTQD